MKCTECDGRRVIIRMERQWWGSSRNGFDTGREVERLYQCERCKGSGVEPDPEPDFIEVEGAPIFAPGFDEVTFAAGLAKARRVGALRMTPARGCVLVTSARTGAQYAVTRHNCSCPGSTTHLRCFHRAAVIACADLYQIDVYRTVVLGFDPDGHPVTERQRAMQVEGMVA